jgi:hypothetical protein
MLILGSYDPCRAENGARNVPVNNLTVEPYKSGKTTIDIYLRNEDGKWVASLTGDLRDTKFEVVRVNKNSWSYSLPAAKPSPNPRLCLTKMKERANFGYLECNSIFFSANLGGTVAGTVLRGVFSLGILTATDAATGNTGFSVSFDQAAFDKAVAESGAIHLAKDTISYQDYIASFEAAKSSRQWQAFISKHKDSYDPDSLVLLAEQRLMEAIEREAERDKTLYRQAFNSASSINELQSFIDRYSQNDPENLIPRANDKLKLMRKLVAEEEDRQRKAGAEEARLRVLAAEKKQKEVAQWRSKLRSGDDTFCGPVIEIKGSMIRIALRVQLPGYGNDAWLKTSEIYPPSSGCQNINGRISPI